MPLWWSKGYSIQHLDPRVTRVTKCDPHLKLNWLDAKVTLSRSEVDLIKIKRLDFTGMRLDLCLETVFEVFFQKLAWTCMNVLLLNIDLFWLSLVIRLEARLQSNIGNTLRPVLMLFTRLGITPPKVNRSEVLWVHSPGLAPADFGCEQRSSESWRARRNFFVMSATHDLPISRRPNFTKFEHNVDRCRGESFGTEFWKFSRKWSFFQKKRKKDFFLRVPIQAAITPQWL